MKKCEFSPSGRC